MVRTILNALWAHWRAVGLFAVGGVAIGGTAAVMAGHLGGTTYTGCVALKGGTLTLLQEGNTPLKPCGPGNVEVHFGSGDITSVLAGAGLDGGGASGNVTLSLAPSFQLPQTCTSGQVAKWTGSGWACASDSDSQYSAGVGLELLGREFSLAPGYRVPNSQDCGGGRFASGIDGFGELICGKPPGVEVFANQKLIGVGTVQIPDNYEPTEVMTLNVPAGIYSITVSGLLSNDAEHDDESTLLCSLLAGTSFLTRGETHRHGGIQEGSLTMMAYRALFEPTQLRVMCSTGDEGVRAALFAIQALKIE